MSDRVYKDVKTFSANGSLSAGTFAKREFKLTSQPTVGQTVVIVWNGRTRTYTFTDDPSIGADQARFSQLNMTDVLIGSDVTQTQRNLLHAINSNPKTIQGGNDTSITVGEGLDGTDPTVLIYSNVKAAGDIVITASTATTSNVSDTTGVATNGYSTETSYTGISVTVASVDLLIRNDVEDQYNIGPPTNGLRKVTVTLPTNQILPIETFGCSVACTVYR